MVQQYGKKYRLYIYGFGLFSLGLILGLSNLLVTNDKQSDIAPAKTIVQETGSANDTAEDALLENEALADNIVTIDNVDSDKPITKLEALALTAADDTEIFHKEIRIKNGQGLMDALLDNGAGRQDAFNAIEANGSLYSL